MPVCYDNGDESVRVREANSEQDMRPRSLDTNLKTHSSLRINSSCIKMVSVIQILIIYSSSKIQLFQ